MDNPDVEKKYWLYVLKLNQGKFYVGITKNKHPEDRIQQHKNGFYSAQWVKKYGYLETVEFRELGYITEAEAKQIEDATTSDYMSRFGRENVRGGELNYSGKYYFRFGRFYRENDWETITVIVFLLLVIIVLAFKIKH